MRFKAFFLLIFISTGPHLISQAELSTENISAEPNVWFNEIWESEQGPLRRRDSLMRLYGPDGPEVAEQQSIFERNHLINQSKIEKLLDQGIWPKAEIRGERGNLIICNVIQHSDLATRMKYLPMMRSAVKAQQLEARLLVRAEDRIATDNGELQIYGGQMKYYPQTKSFNVWPIWEPENVDMRREEMGLEPIAVFLKRRFDFVWDLEEQVKRSREFEESRKRSE